VGGCVCVCVCVCTVNLCVERVRGEREGGGGRVVNILCVRVRVCFCEQRSNYMYICAYVTK
jgi:hypothetical protein